MILYFMNGLGNLCSFAFSLNIGFIWNIAYLTMFNIDKFVNSLDYS